MGFIEASKNKLTNCTGFGNTLISGVFVLGFKTEISEFLIPILLKQCFSNFPVCGINLITWSSVSEVGPPRFSLFFRFLSPYPQCRLRSVLTLFYGFFFLGGMDRNSLLCLFLVEMFCMSVRRRLSMCLFI